ncbi:ATP-binding cassette sub-family C member 4-like isoform X2 [Portunus trituberculatus]|uniref:ATP-binding cassette sub-family C member 4-like isoform X2 n=1 Tax=Portunus trituberculatus TaxID=210409 RepID=UPI001E1CE088|nr:ATP-binding cassette sub-family C member 4-like isoform X2 [Portunus trituberculatus]
MATSRDLSESSASSCVSLHAISASIPDPSSAVSGPASVAASGSSLRLASSSSPRRWRPDKGIVGSVTRPNNPCPGEKANVISWLLMWWLIPLLRQGNRRSLNEDDLYTVQSRDASFTLGNRLQKEWDKELEESKIKKRKTSFVRALIRCFGWEFAAVGILAAIEECVLRIGQPLCLGYLIRYFNGEEGYTFIDGWIYSTGVVMGSLLYIFTHHPYFFGVQHGGMTLRISSCSLIYRKALRLSKAALGKTTTGQMVNLLSNDVNRFDTSAIFLHYIWIGPLQTLIVLGILWNEIGAACLAGIMLLILFVPFQTWLGRVFSKLRMATAHRTDERVRIMHEIINAMRIIKMYTWEKPFTALTEAARKSELGVIMETNYYRAVNMSLFLTSSKVIIFVCLLTYVLTDNVLTAEKVFVTSSLINNVRLVMTLFFPFAIAMGSETLISCKRLQEFLEMEEREDTSHIDKPNLRPKPKDCCLVMSGVTAKWSNITEDNTLTNVSFSVKAGELLAIVGPVGAGKGSLLNAILGELPAQSGRITVRGKIAYASQEPWVFSGTVRQNILFGKQLNEKKYEEVVRVCALEQDFKELPDGDMTTVGERGMALSGGQKARVNLARAVYADADIYLLDDPLSAVDSHVSRHLFDNCIMKHLKHKVRVLVTHQLQYLSSASEILVLKEGHMEAIGPYHQLVNSGLDFGTLISENQEEEITSSFSSRKASVKKSNSINKAILSERILRERKRTDSTSSTHQLEESILGSSISLHDSVEADNILTISGAHTTGSSTAISSGMSNSSYNDSKAIEAKNDNNNEKETSGNKEIRSHGSVKAKVYLKYFLAGGGWCIFALLIIINIFAQVLFSGIDYWLAYWANGEQIRAQIVLNSSTWDIPKNTTVFSYSNAPVPEGYMDTNTNIYIYSGMTVGLFLLSLCRTVVFFTLCMKSSKTLHNNMFRAIIRVPIKFFDTHPVGQILNRFTKDLGQIDELLPTTMFDVITIFLNFLGIIIIIALVNVWLLIPTVFLGMIFVYLRRFYLCSARDVKRLEGITRSPVFTHLSTSLQGLTTIRAFEMQQTFMDEFDSHQDLHSSAWFLFLCTTRWFGICLDWLSCIYISMVTYSFMALPDTLGGDIGLAISSAMLLSGMFQWGVRQSAEVENQMTSVERVLEYSSFEPEAALNTEAGKVPKDVWPDSGVLKFVNVSLKYNEETTVLKNLNFNIQAKEKIGIVGRTGAGKSSLITSLFRLTEPSGVIYIDGIKIQELGLHDVRGNISIIPQDPTLFSGTMRKNLDPFHQHSDEQLWKSLEEVQLKTAVSDMGGLETQMAEGGINLSVGQRQLVCLARAILRHNKILVLDEATANVDPRTDELIQQTIRTKFAECTVLTIAHRLHTIMDSDRVMVLQAGQLMEFDTPYNLLNNKTSIFFSLVQQTGQASAKQLHQIAEMAHQRQQDSEGNTASGSK